MFRATIARHGGMLAAALVKLVLFVLRRPLMAAFRFACRWGLALWPHTAVDRAEFVRLSVKHGRLGPFLARFFLHPETGEPYMMRVCLTPFHGGRLGRAWTWLRLPELFLHYFFKSDEDRELHNHPWVWGVSLILAGGHLETREDFSIPWGLPREYEPGDVNTIWDHTYHRVTLLDENAGCWSLFVGGPRTPGEAWGFLQDDGTTLPHREYHAKRAIERLRQNVKALSSVYRPAVEAVARTFPYGKHGNPDCPRCGGDGVVIEGPQELSRCPCSFYITQAERDAAT